MFISHMIICNDIYNYYMVYINGIIHVNINAQRTTLCGGSKQVRIWYKYRSRWPGGPNLEPIPPAVVLYVVVVCGVVILFFIYI